MNVFEDLLVELKEENLLESSAADPAPARTNGVGRTNGLGSSVAGMYADTDIDALFDSVLLNDDDGTLPMPKPTASAEVSSETIVNDVSDLQMVEHVIGGIEREYSHVTTNSSHLLSAKAALHRYLLASGTTEPDAVETAGQELADEIAFWMTALYDRDEAVAVPAVRRFCENSKPPLNSQVLFALARFYRNSPYSDNVRSKFDFFVTRLFSKNVGGEKREMLFGPEETITHLRTRCPSRSGSFLSDQDEADIMLMSVSFRDLMSEADAARSLDELFAGDLFGRIKLFKESIGDRYFDPRVTAAAIECNVHVGNRYLELLDAEKEKFHAGSIQDRFGNSYDRSVSDAAARTLYLGELLKAKVDDGPADVPDTVQPKSKRDRTKPVKSANKPTDATGLMGSFQAVNKWLLLATFGVILISIGFYLWASLGTADDPTLTSNVQKVDMASSPFKQYVKAGRISSETFYGVATPEWDAMSKDERVELLGKMLTDGKGKGYSKVNMVNEKGRSVGFASPQRVDVREP